VPPRWALASLAVATACRADAAPPAIGLVATAPVVEVLDPAGAIDPAAVQDAFARIARGVARCGGDTGWAGDAMAWIVVDSVVADTVVDLGDGVSAQG